ncbi:MAG TPA: hypothetical protein VGB90_02360, partial [Alphaproteobacteria bacterium]
MTASAHDSRTASSAESSALDRRRGQLFHRFALALAALVASAAIAPVGWLVLVEFPLADVDAPPYGSLARAGILIVVLVALAVGAALLLARRIAGPI